MLAEDNDEMIQFLKAYQQDIQYTGPNTKPWRFDGAWHTSGKCTQFTVNYLVAFI